VTEELRSGRVLHRSAWPELPEGAVLLVPLGSTEQHGPHLPTGTDTAVAAAVVDAAAAVVGDRLPLVIAPAVTYGASGEHEHFPGTVSIGHEALALLLTELGRSASRWAGRILFVNGHGGNLPTVPEVVRSLRAESRDVAWLPCSRPGADPHAGAFETSLMLALHPDDVRAGEARPGATAPLAELLPAMREGGVRAVSPSGVLGDPTTADADAGQASLRAMAADVAARLLRWDVDATGLLRP
jgi:creatinine amidohydrolase